MGMKKLLAVLFSALLLVGVAGCGGNNAQQAQNPAWIWRS